MRLQNMKGEMRCSAMEYGAVSRRKVRLKSRVPEAVAVRELRFMYAGDVPQPCSRYGERSDISTENVEVLS